MHTTAAIQTPIQVYKPQNNAALQVAGFLDHSTVNGAGFRSVLFLSGCRHNCFNCHNKDMQDFNYGEKISISDVMIRINKNLPLIDGVTLSGGEPFEQSKELLELLKELKKYNLSVWAYTGYLYEQLQADSLKSKLLPYIDVLIDGPYIEALADENLKYCGSSNQRVLKLSNGQVESFLNFYNSKQAAAY